ncbi:MAG: hypothetical protein AAI978_00900 [Candidatus Hodgkinia cicadicola]
MITTIATYVAIQQAIDYLVTSYLRLKSRKQRVQKAREALRNVPKVRVINTAEYVAKRKELELRAEQRRQERALARLRTKLMAVPQTVQTNSQATLAAEANITSAAAN